ncbi:hypothetical protein BDQ17DRAFT_1393521 [Cyathus striatus]|nr:hypothetical protein BDQ17DRAFT_1393521 [Cyathus striatus]
MSLDNEGIERHPEFYFHDGSVVILCLKELVSFRVHQSVLSRLSSFFAGMFDLPQPPNPELIDGCPIIKLEDTLQDIEDTLRAIYDPLFFDTIQPDTELGALIDAISGILRISTKYDMQSFRKKCMSIIKEKFPSTLEGCDRLIIASRKYEPRSFVKLIPLARETELLEVLPWAYYLCTQMETKKLMDDDILSWKDKALCLAGREILFNYQTTETHPFHFEFIRSPQCASRCEFRSSLTRHDIDIFRQSPHPLDYYNFSELHVCSRCATHAEQQMRTGRVKLWEDLPNIFRLGTWQSIREIS